MASATTPKQQCAVLLTELMSSDSDVLLRFDDGQTVPGHSQVLKLCSGVLRTAIEAETSSGGRAFSSANPLTIPMPGTAKEQWLTAAEFMYPIVPSPAVSLANLEVLLVIGSKYNCPALLSKALTFIRSLTTQLNVTNPNTDTFVWKWIHLADSLGLIEGAAQLISTIAFQDYCGFSASCKVDGRLAGLSPDTLQLIVCGLVSGGQQSGIAYCIYCKVLRKFSPPANAGYSPTCSWCRHTFSW